MGLGVLERFDCTVYSNDGCILENNLVRLLVTDRDNISLQEKDRSGLLDFVLTFLNRDLVHEVCPNASQTLTCRILGERFHQSFVQQTRPFQCRPQ